MDQTIGIIFAARGDELIMDAVTRIQNVLVGLEATAANVATNMTASMTKINTVMGTAKDQIIQLDAQMKKLAATAGTVGSGMMVGGTGKGPTGVGEVIPMDRVTKGGGGITSGKFVPFFMLRWMAYGAGIMAVRKYIKDILLGAARDKILDEENVLSGLGMTGPSINKVEEEGWKFLRKAPQTGTIHDYMKAAAETVSGANLTGDMEKMSAEKGAEVAAITTQLSMLYAKAFESSPQVFSNMFGRIVQAKKMFMDAETRSKYDTGELDLAQLYLNELKGVQAVILSTDMWGPGMKEIMKHALPSALGIGMDVGEIMALGGVLTTGGRQGNISSRMMRQFIEKDIAGFGKLELMGGKGGGKYWERYKKTKPEKRQQIDATLREMWQKKLAISVEDTFKEAAENVERARKRGIADPVATAGIPAMWAPAIKQMMLPGFWERYRDVMTRRAKELEERLSRNLTVQEQLDEMTRILGAPITNDMTWRSMHMAGEEMWNAWAKTSLASKENQDMANSVTNALRKTADYFRGTASSVDAWSASLDAIGKVIKRPFDAIWKTQAEIMDAAIAKEEREYMRKYHKDPRDSVLGKINTAMDEAFMGMGFRRPMRWTPADFNEQGRQSMIPREFYADLDRMRPTPPPTLRAPLPEELPAGRDMTGDTISAAPKEGGIMQALSGLKEMVTTGIEAAKIAIQLTVNVDGHQIGSYIEEIDRKNDKQAGRPAGSTFKKK